MNKDLVRRLNILILSMVTKQKVLNDLKSEVFKINVYEQYINELIDIILLNLNLDQEKYRYRYKELIKLFIKGEINDPEVVIKKLQRECNSTYT